MIAAMTTIRIFRDARGARILREGSVFVDPAFSFDALFREDDPVAWVEHRLTTLESASAPEDVETETWWAPVESQEIWAAGVTYYRSRTARMEESEAAGGDRFYDLVYEAERPELFFKATAARARGHRQHVAIRADSTWDVPEPELALAINAGGRIFGHLIGNDMSSRSIEGENPLYLPQAKVYRASCAIGPCLRLGDPLPTDAGIRLAVHRGGARVFHGATTIDQLKRTPEELASFLFRDNEFPCGAILLTGTGIVPDPDFTLHSGDEVRISIDGIGTLVNPVA